MGSGGPIREKGRNIEDLHDLRLMALLHELVRGKGHGATATVLGIDHRTVAASIKGGKTSWRVREALEQALQAGAGSVAAQQRERNEALEQRIKGIAEEIRSSIGDIRTDIAGEIKALGDEYGNTLRQLERRMAQVEAGQSGQVPANGASSVSKPVVSTTFRRLYPEPVTIEPADDEEVFGDAWPFIEEWRRLGHGGVTKTKGLSRLKERERVLRLELPMVNEHGLTLPPEKQPLVGIWRNDQRRWREKALDDVYGQRVKRELLRWVRRLLTLGLWWK